MNVVVCWLGMQGYVAACLRELNRRPDLTLHVLHLDFKDTPKREELLGSISNRRYVASQHNGEIADDVARRKPDVVLLCGWYYGPYRRLVNHPALAGTRFVLGMDTPWTGALRQRINRFLLRGFMQRMDQVIVAGLRSADFARRIDATPGKIVTGLYGFDYERFADAAESRSDAEWPRRFLFAGRYVPVKGIDTLLDAYRRYRQSVSDPWPINFAGTGPDAHLLQGQSGVTDIGYVQPSALPALFADHGVFIMPSREEPWGVAIAEAAAAGLPLICTEVCGAASDLLRQYYNGLTVPPDDPQLLAAAMLWTHQHHERLREMGGRSRELARPFSAEAWAERVHACFERALALPRTG